MERDGQLEGLMLQYQQGQGSALAELYRRLAPGMLGYLVRLGHDRATAEDLLQEVFLRLHRVRHTYQPGSPVKPWVYAIARYVAIDALRQRGRKREVSYEEGVAAESNPGTRSPGEVREDLEELELGLGSLPEGQREALLLTRVSGLSTREAAAAMGVSEGAVKVKVHRALQALRRALGGRERDG